MKKKGILNKIFSIFSKASDDVIATGKFYERIQYHVDNNTPTKEAACDLIPYAQDIFGAVKNDFKDESKAVEIIETIQKAIETGSKICC